ncbi:MAG: DUF5658 family protein [Candidatus Caldatribacteriota bacterium]
MKNWVTWILFFVIVIYQILDAYQTKLLFDVGATELNPLLAHFIDESDSTSSFYKILTFKAIPITILGIALFLFLKKGE